MTRAMMRTLLLIALVAAGCHKDRPLYVEPRTPCADHDPLKRVYFGDLHVHTTFSFDAHAFEVRNSPADAYRFARGEPLSLPPLDASGQGTRTVKLDRPLDFVAVTDHSEFLGEVETCTTPGSSGYDSSACASFRAGGNPTVVAIGILLADPRPARSSDICGSDGKGCAGAAGSVWGRIQEAAADAYDKSAACSFTSFVAYEYSAATNLSTLHRNVIFANDHVPEPISYFEQPTPQGLWRELTRNCLENDNGCDVLAIPHNPNESNGNMFDVEYPGAKSLDEQRDQARLRSQLEPLLEVYQHKGASECYSGLAGVLGAPDEQCSFEAPRRDPFSDCGDTPGAGGISHHGCLSRRDFARGILLAGLAEEARLGVNPYRLGFIASTDTHNGTPGFVHEHDFAGHRGTDDDTDAKRLGSGELTAGGIEFSGGGLTAVWAEENSRPAIFSALRRRETYGTSGPRMSVRFYGGWGLDAALCDDADLVAHASAAGVPMGGDLPRRPGGASAPRFVVTALRDPGSAAHAGTPLERVQIVKGWIDADGAHEKVFDIAGGVGASVDASSCTPQGSGADSLCGVFVDPDFHPEQRAFYYARVLENPTCRWSTFACNALAVDARPPSCSDASVPKVIQERAWTSPIFYDPS